MTDGQIEAKASYPYMTPAQWFGVRAKLRQSVPKAIDVDWLMAALGTSEKGARNILPQLRAVGLLEGDGSPSNLAHDLRDDDHYAEACRRTLEAVYPDGLRNAYDDPNVEYTKVASWFMRNARTGQVTANMQAKLYLALLKAELPSDDEKPRTSPRRRTTKKESNSGPVLAHSAATQLAEQPAPSTNLRPNASIAPHSNGHPQGPALHVDLQIHISADASDAQIDAVFRSMAKHLYGRE